ncbi:unknown [Firmicutes bacterium CAG:884]|nr:unknown [Firmicutes bacterium CAG:884]
MKIILSALCIIGLFYIIVFFKRKSANYYQIINKLDNELEKNKTKIKSNNKIIEELDKQISKYDRK